MKNLIVVILMSACLNVFSQVNKGSMFAGGTMNYYSHNNKNEASTSINNFNSISSYKRVGFGTDLNYGFFVSDRIAVGPLFTIRQNRQESTYDYYDQTQYTDYKDSYMGIGLFARWYKMTKTEKFGFFIQLSGQYETDENSNKSRTVPKNPGYINTQNSSSYAGAGMLANLGTGVVYFINKKIGLEARLGGIQYQNSKGTSFTDGQKASASSTTWLNLNYTMSSFFFGANIYFGGKKTEAPPTSK